MTPDDDPGWPRSLSILAVLVPGALQWYLRRSRGRDGLITLRQVFLSFSMALVLFGVVIAFLDLKGGSVMPWLLILVAIAFVSLGASRVVEKPLDCSSDEQLAGTYRTRFFLRIAFGESVALFAFVAVFTGAPVWMYYAGAAVSLIWFWTRAAPTRTALARDQESLNASGCSRSLVAALRTVPPQPRAR
jgi:F0F1-type ATP synthase membrane subunit c/vacuolar-type H+-ATPase subunit K